MKKRIEDFSQPLPIVIKANWINAMGIIRSLAIEQIPSIAIADDPLGLGLFSNQTIGLRCPDYANSPQSLAGFLLDLADRLQQPGIIMPTDDATLETLIQINWLIEGKYKKTYPRVELLDFILDKHNQILSAGEAGIPVPFTVAPENPSDINSWPSELFPCVVKGRRGKSFYNTVGFQARLIEHPEKLAEIFSQIDPKLAIIQEYIPGNDEQFFGYRFYISDDGKVLAKYTTQKLLQTPRNFGVMRRGITISNSDISDQSLQWLSETGYQGLGYIEYKFDQRDGQYKLIELNARSWSTLFMGTLCGVNLPAVMYRAITENKFDPIVGQKDGVEWVSHVEELLSVSGEILKRQFNFRDWSRHLPKGKDVIFGWKDPLPGLIAPFYAIHSYFNRRKKSRGRFQKRII